MSAESRPDLQPTTFHDAVSKIISEAGEALQAAGKMQQFGFNPIDLKTGKSYNNVRDFFEECRQLQHAIEEAKRLFKKQYACQTCFGVGGPGNNLFGDDSYEGRDCYRCGGRGY